NANQNAATYAKLGHRVVGDEVSGFAGPLAGLHAGLRAVNRAANRSLVVTVPCDSPFLPLDLVARLHDELKENQVAVARTGDQAHPVFALVRTQVLQNLEQFLAG